MSPIISGAIGLMIVCSPSTISPVQCTLRLIKSSREVVHFIPGEASDLSGLMPEKLEMLKNAWNQYAKDVGVVPRG